MESIAKRSIPDKVACYNHAMFDQVLSIMRMFAFGPMLALGFLIGSFVFWKKGKEEYYDQNSLMDAMLISCFWVFIGARLGYIAVRFPLFGFDILKWFSLVAQPGYLGIIGLVAGYVSLRYFAKKHKWDVYEILDFGALGVTIAYVFINLGMFLNGSGFGNATTLPVGLYFPGVFDKRHPVQLYSMIFSFLLFITLWRLESVYRTYIWYRANKRTAQTGFLIAIFCVAFGIFGAVISFFSNSFFLILGIPLEFFFMLALTLYGIGVLYVRSGRVLFPKKQKKKEDE